MTRLTPTARRLHRLLTDDRGGELAHASNDDLARLLCVTRRSVTSALTRLVDAGLLAIDTRRGHPHTDPTARTLRVATPEDITS